MEAKTWMRAFAGTVIGLGGVLAVVCALVPAIALAGRPPPPPPPPVEAGVIYYMTYIGSWEVWAMTSSGTSKTRVLSGLPGWAEPSLSLHDGKRWFLVELPVEGTYPDGNSRREAFALSDAGDRVQLTDDPSLQSQLDYWGDADDFFKMRWAENDRKVTFLARRWGTDGNEAPAVVETGLYAVDLGPGSVADPALQPAVPGRIPIDFPTRTAMGEDPPYLNGLLADVGRFDWAPDGRSVAYGSSTGLYVANLDTGVTLRLFNSDWSVCRWSPDGTTILFGSGILYAISPDGTNQRVLVQGEPTRKTEESLWHGVWSPSGAHLAYQSVTRSLKAPYYFLAIDIYRATTAGTDKANLTGDIGNSAFPLGWRRAP